MSEKKASVRRKTVVDFQSREEQEKAQAFELVLSTVPKDGTVTLPPMLFLVWGEEKTGKTHLLASISELMPVYILDTEYRAEYVQKKFENVHVARCSSFLDIFLSVKGIINKYPKGMVVIDSGTDFHKFAAERVMEEHSLDRLWPITTWDWVYFKERAILNALKDNGFHVGITARAKPEYMNQEKTGKILPNCFNELPYKSDLVIHCNEDKTKVVERNGWGISRNITFSIEDSLPILINRMKELP